MYLLMLNRLFLAEVPHWTLQAQNDAESCWFDPDGIY